MNSKGPRNNTILTFFERELNQVLFELYPIAKNQIFILFLSLLTSIKVKRDETKLVKFLYPMEMKCIVTNHHILPHTTVKDKAYLSTKPFFGLRYWYLGILRWQNTKISMSIDFDMQGTNIWASKNFHLKIQKKG